MAPFYTIVVQLRRTAEALQKYIEDPLSEALSVDLGTIQTRPAFIEVFLDDDKLFYRPVDSKEQEGVLLYNELRRLAAGRWKIKGRRDGGPFCWDSPRRHRGTESPRPVYGLRPKPTELEPPPLHIFAGVETMTWAVPGAAIKLAGTAACSWVTLTNAVGIATPLKKTTEFEAKSRPVTMRVNCTPPAVALLGEREVIEGASPPDRHTLSQPEQPTVRAKRTTQYKLRLEMRAGISLLPLRRLYRDKMASSAVRVP